MDFQRTQSRRRAQKVVFPEGVYYTKKNRNFEPQKSILFPAYADREPDSGENEKGQITQNVICHFQRREDSNYSLKDTSVLHIIQ